MNKEIDNIDIHRLVLSGPIPLKTNFFRALSELLRNNKTVKVSLGAMPSSYRENPSNLCHKLKSREGLSVEYIKIGNEILFLTKNET